MELNLRGDHSRDVLGIGGCAGTAAVHILRHVVDLFAVLIGHNGARCGSCVSAEDDAILEDDAANSGTSLLHLRHLVTAEDQAFIAEQQNKTKQC